VFRYTYLSHPKFNYIYIYSFILFLFNFFASNFETLYLFKFLILVVEVVSIDEDAIEHDKLM
jgi:hypothetical protein